jgi:hypothetical protein
MVTGGPRSPPAGPGSAWCRARCCCAGQLPCRGAGGPAPLTTSVPAGPAVCKVEQAPTSDQGADLLEACAELLGAGFVHEEVVLVPVRGDGVLPLLEPGEHVVHLVLRTGDEAVEGHGHVGDKRWPSDVLLSVRLRPASREGGSYQGVGAARSSSTPPLVGWSARARLLLAIVELVRSAAGRRRCSAVSFVILASDRPSSPRGSTMTPACLSTKADEVSGAAGLGGPLRHLGRRRRHPARADHRRLHRFRRYRSGAAR